ncbi:hypothetical protein KD050_18870 [Psychrobacillus sp. INOP01]|uniref:hypothetical protein n=1 Tax=Psychrobacillus sp. INOP01 TaxID=2829187 RepID=UPI001BA62C2E|nr:hypothetical protein [Psychrobacillus sp. INOP01]QUG41313.1 hypothetical protein KD050_18870 [Psychrobacillus sp. INOP01]
MGNKEDAAEVDLTELWDAHELMMDLGLEPLEALNMLTDTWIKSMLQQFDDYDLDWNTGEYKRKDRTIPLNIPPIE